MACLTAEISNWLLESLDQLGMQYGALVVDARFFLPQSRPRVFVIAVDSNVDCSDFTTFDADEESPWLTKKLIGAYRRLSPRIQEKWLWWRLAVPKEPIPALESIIEDPPTSVRWHDEVETRRLTSLMTERNRLKVTEAILRRNAVGFLYKRMRAGVQRAEVRFDGIAGCLRTPEGGSSRQTVVIVDDGRLWTRLLSPREGARLMGVPDDFWLPESYNQAYRAVGDGVAVPVVRWLSDHLLDPLATLCRSVSADLSRPSDAMRFSFGLDGSMLEIDEGQTNMTELAEEVLAVLSAWYRDAVPSGDMSNPSVPCVGLAVCEHMRDSFPLERRDYVTRGNQLRTSGSLIHAILQRHGETRRFLAEGGRTTRGNVPLAERLANALNEIQAIAELSPGGRELLTHSLQEWLVSKVREYMNQQRIQVEVNVQKPASRIVADLIAAADQKRGAVAQHLVGAKLALRYPDVHIDNYNYTAADHQLQRPGDFVVGDTVFHVTVAPMPTVFEDRCKQNLMNDYRVYVLVPDAQTDSCASDGCDYGLGERRRDSGNRALHRPEYRRDRSIP